MAKVKINSNNYDNKLIDWKNNTGTSRADILYYSNEELNQSDIFQVAWKKGLIISIDKQSYYSTITYIDILT